MAPKKPAWPPDNEFFAGNPGIDLDWIEVGEQNWITRPQIWGGEGTRGDRVLSSWWAHRSPKIARNDLGRIVYGEGHHTLVSAEPLHIEPSLLCLPENLCGLHGFVRDGVWVPA